MMFPPCFPMYHWRRPYYYSPTKLSLMTGLMKRIILISILKLDLVDLLRAATKDQLFTFNGQLYEQTDGVDMDSPLGPLLANAFMCSIEETLERKGKMPTYYKRFVDDTLTIMPNKTSADNFLYILNQCHSSINFTMETENNSMLPF